MSDAIRFFSAWKRTLNDKLNPINGEYPWITFPAIRFLERTLTKDMRVYEYGIGGSTLFFVKRVGEVISVEHDQEWGHKVTEILHRRNYNNWQIHLIEPIAEAMPLNSDPSDPDAYVSADINFKGWSFKDYASSIDQYPDEYFDLVLIDGRARPSCFKHTIPKVKINGYIMWDNTDRGYYLPTMRSAPEFFEIKEFPGPSPCVTYFSRTSVWRRQS